MTLACGRGLGCGFASHGSRGSWYQGDPTPGAPALVAATLERAALRQGSSLMGDHSRSPSATRSTAVLAVVIGLTGVLLLLVVALILLHSTSLSFFLSGLSVFRGMPRAIPAAILIVMGVSLVAISPGIWHRGFRSFIAGVLLSLAQILLGVLSHDYSSFIFIRGVIVLA